MAELPTPEESGRAVLQIYEHFGTRPGEGLLPQNFLVRIFAMKLRKDDLVNGLEYGVEAGWFESGPNDMMILTDAGFAEI